MRRPQNHRATCLTNSTAAAAKAGNSVLVRLLVQGLHLLVQRTSDGLVGGEQAWPLSHADRQLSNGSNEKAEKGSWDGLEDHMGSTATADLVLGVSFAKPGGLP